MSRNGSADGRNVDNDRQLRLKSEEGTDMIRALFSVILGLTFLPAFCLRAEAQFAEWFRADLSTGELVPPGYSHGFGVVETERSFFFCMEEDSVDIDFTLGYREFTDGPNGAYLYRGARGQNGDLAYVLSAGTWESGSVVTVRIACSDLPELRHNGFYAVMTREGLPRGAVRGQLLYGFVDPTLEVTWGRIRSLYR
jgi:hypothetical protein